MVALIILAFFLWFCQNKYFYQHQEINQAPQKQKIIVVNSILPLWQITNFLASDKIENILLIKPTDSEHDFQLKNQNLLDLQRADLIFYLSKNLENLFVKIQQNPDFSNKTKEIAQNTDFKLLANNWHLWLNPHNVILIANWQTKQLCQIDVKNCWFYQKNLQKFHLQITKEANKIKELFLQHKSNKSIALLHDAYNYFFDYFNINNIIVLSHHHQGNMKIQPMQKLISKNQQISCLMAESNNPSAQKIAESYGLKYQELNLFHQSTHQNNSNIIADSLWQMAQQTIKCL